MGQPDSKNIQQKDSAIETPVQRDPNKIYPYAIFLNKSAPTTEAANYYAQDFAKSVNIILEREDIFRLGDISIGMLVQITPMKAAELKRDPRVRLI